MPPPDPSKVPLGTVLGGKFRITREIGRGGMAAVYEAQNVAIGKRVAVKVLSAELMTSRVVRERFLREARAAAAIRSPYICDVYDSGTYQERPFLVMELLEGESLYEMMTRVRRLDVETTLTVATHVCRGLAKAHEAGVVHRDLKPENVFLTRDEDGDLLAKIVDFGLAKFYEAAEGDAAQVRLTREGALFGTPAYMSPEQAKGRGEVDGRSDLWALGCIVYECLTGQTVWNVDQGVAMILAQIASAPLPRPSKLRPELPASFDAWFLRALERDVDRRFQTPKELADTLSVALRGEPRPSSRSSFLVAPPPSSDQELEQVDSLLSPDAEGPTLPAPEVVERMPPTSSVEAPTPPPSTASPAAAPRPARGGVGIWLGLVLALSALGGGAFLGARHFGLLPGTVVVTAPPTTASDASSAPAGSGSAGPATSVSAAPEQEPWTASLARAQALVGGEPTAVLAALKGANDESGGAGPARGLLAQAGAALADTTSPCKLGALGRPRPFSSTLPVSRPTFAATEDGGMLAWVDNQEDARKRQAFAVRVDEHGRRLSAPRLLTPEAESVRHAQLFPVAGGLGLLYWDEAGKDPGVYVRRLERDGRIAGPARRLSGSRAFDFWPSIAPGATGYWAVWAEPVDGAAELMVRQLDRDLEPQASAVRLSALRRTRGIDVGITMPAVATHGGRLHVVFAVVRGTASSVALLTLPEDAKGLTTGVEVKPGGPARDTFLGKVEPLTPEKGKSTQPRIACGSSGCAVTWDDEKGGAFVGWLEGTKGEKLWHRELARKGQRPEVTASGENVFVAWYESSRVKVARVDRDGVQGGGTAGKVSGFQPYPELSPTTDGKSFWVAWRDYESGRLEAYVARVSCP